MSTLQSQIEKMARDVTTGPTFSESIEVGVVGALVGGVLGYLKDRRSMKDFAMWGAGVGVAGQYMLFHMLKPSFRHASVSTRGDASSCHPGEYYDEYYNKCLPIIHDAFKPVAARGEFDEYVGENVQCSPGTYWDEYYQKCLPIIPGAFKPKPMPATLADWETAHRVGAVNRGGYRADMPYGPGPWPMNYATQYGFE